MAQICWDLSALRDTNTEQEEIYPLFRVTELYKSQLCTKSDTGNTTFPQRLKKRASASRRYLSGFCTVQLLDEVVERVSLPEKNKVAAEAVSFLWRAEEMKERKKRYWGSWRDDLAKINQSRKNLIFKWLFYHKQSVSHFKQKGVGIYFHFSPLHI